jgi:aminoglycoside phosphotransferase (APT) family kinase protein
MASQKHPRWLRLRIWVGTKLYKHYASAHVLRIGFGQVLKRRCDPAEVQAMEYIRQHTSIPVPKVFKVYKQEGSDREDVVMGYVGGQTLEEAWPKMTKVLKQAVVKELAGYIEQMRKLVPPRDGFVGSVSHGTGYDHRFGGDRFGPFNNMKDFHTYILRHDSLDAWREERDVVQVHSRPNSYASKFTHGDLVPSNVIVKDGKIAAIIDWETAGWFPEYWEYTKIRYQWRPYREEFYREIDRVMVTYPVELRAEQAIWKRYDWYAYELPTTRRE